MKSVEDETLVKLMSLYSDCGVFVKMYARLRIRLIQLSRIVSFLPKSGIILDLGCGYGLLANYLSIRLQNAKIIGLDLDPKRIEIAQKTVRDRSNIEFLSRDLTGDLSGLPSCSGIVLTDVLHHLPLNYQSSILKQIFALLERNGVLVMLEVNPLRSSIGRRCLNYISEVILNPGKVYYQKPDQLEKELISIGFTVRYFLYNSMIQHKIIYVCSKT